MFTVTGLRPGARSQPETIRRWTGTRARPTTATVLLGLSCSALVLTPTAVAMVVVVASAAVLAFGGGCPPASASRSPASVAFARTAVVMLIGVAASFADAPLGARSAIVLAQFALVALIALMFVGVPDGRIGVDDVHRAVMSAATASCAFALVQVSVLGNPRAEGATANAIVFGDLALVLAVMTLALRPTEGTRARRRLPDRTLVVAGLGFAAAIASGTRGVIIAGPVLLAVLLACRPELRLRRSRRTCIAAGAAVAFGMLAITATRGVLVQRLSTVAHDVTTYVGAAPTDAAAETSIGARFEAWRAAGSAFLGDPFSGVGWGNLGGLFDAQVATGQRNERIATFEHAHQQLLGSLASGGIVGAAVMVAMLAVPALWFVRAVRFGGPDDRRLGSAGLVVITGFAVFGLTESIFESFAPVAFYAVVVGSLTSLIRPDQWVARQVETAGVDDTRAGRSAV